MAAFAETYSFGEWLTYLRGVYLRFEHRRYALCVELNTQGMGACTIQLGKRVFTRFIDGRVVESGLIFGDFPLGETQGQDRPMPRGPTSLGNVIVTQQDSGTVVVEHRLSGSRIILEPYGETLGAECLRRAQTCSLLEILRKEFGAQRADRVAVLPHISSIPERDAIGRTPTSPAATDASIQPPPWEADTHKPVVQEEAPNQGTAADAPDELQEIAVGNLVRLSTVEGRRIELTLPFDVDARERQIVELLGRYGKVTESGLRKSLNSKRARLIASGLVRKLHDHDFPLVAQRESSDSEGQIYEFDYTLINRSFD